jgi:hypothetical protein
MVQRDWIQKTPVWRKMTCQTDFLPFGLIAYATWAFAAYGQDNDNAAPEAERASSVGLKDAFAGKFLIGAAGDLRGYSDEELENIKANYDVITPENCMKPQPLHPGEDRYSWYTSDAMVQWCEDNDIQVWGHTLLWHSQTGRWFFRARSQGGDPVTRELAMNRLKEHITTVVGRYKGTRRSVGMWSMKRSTTAATGRNGEPAELQLVPDRRAGRSDHGVQVGARGGPGGRAVLQRLRHRAAAPRGTRASTPVR